MNFAISLLSFYVGGSLYILIVNSEIDKLVICANFALVSILLFLLSNIVSMAAVWTKLKISPRLILKNSFPTALIALTTASSSVAYPSLYTACTKNYAINQNLANFGLPFLNVLYKPGVLNLYIAVAFTMACSHNISISLSWIFTAFVLSVFLSIAVPPLPGGVTATYTILFLQLGLPTETIAMIIAVDLILDFVSTAADTINIHAMMLLAAKKFNMIPNYSRSNKTVITPFKK